MVYFSQRNFRVILGRTTQMPNAVSSQCLNILNVTKVTSTSQKQLLQKETIMEFIEKLKNSETSLLDTCSRHLSCCGSRLNSCVLLVIPENYRDTFIKYVCPSRILRACSALEDFMLHFSKKYKNLQQKQGQLMHKYEQLKHENDLLSARFYRDDVILDSETAHPRLEVFENGKCVKDTGKVSKVSKHEKRFDSHLFVLAKDGFSKGKHYWEVNVGKRKNWCLGVASESIDRKGTITLSPQNGYWVIRLEDGRDFMAQTKPPIHLSVNSKPTIIGIFLNLCARSLVFYDVQRKINLYTFTNVNISRELYPFFSTGSALPELEIGPLRIPPWFEEEETVAEE